MELVSNLLWAAIAAVLLITAYRSASKGQTKLSVASAMTVAILACAILLPAISMTDDLLADRQSALPASSQTWHLAYEACATGFDILPSGQFELDLRQMAQAAEAIGVPSHPITESVAMRLVRAHRLRPPLTEA